MLTRPWCPSEGLEILCSQGGERSESEGVYPGLQSGHGVRILRFWQHGDFLVQGGVRH